jgi:hypothetical protein
LARLGWRDDPLRSGVAAKIIELVVRRILLASGVYRPGIIGVELIPRQAFAPRPVNILGIAVKVPAVVVFPRSTDVIAIVKEIDGLATLRGEDGVESPPGEELGISRLASWLIGGGRR